MTEATQPQNRPAVLTVEEWATEMRISRSAAYQAVKNGDVQTIRIGRMIRIPASTVPSSA
jgi:excisionase family DNA binding protein